MGDLVLRGNPYIDQILTYSDKDTFFDTLVLLSKLRKMKFELAIDFMFNPRSALLTFLSSAKTSYSIDSRRGFLYHKTFPRLSEKTYIVNEKLNLLKQIGIKGCGIELDLSFTPEDTEPFKIFLKETLNSSSALRIVLSPTHRRSMRMWPLERYAEISDYLTSEWGAHVVWLWGPGEEHVAQKAMSFCHESSHLAPKTNFRQLAAFIANCDLFIGNSNGPSHVAVSTRTCSLQLHGHTSGQSWCPDSLRHRFIQSSSFGQPNATLGPITVDQVIKELDLMKSSVQERAEKLRSIGILEDWKIHP